METALMLKLKSILSLLETTHVIDATVSGESYARYLAYNKHSCEVVNVIWNEDEESPKEVTHYHLPCIKELKKNESFRRILIDTQKQSGVNDDYLQVVRKWLDAPRKNYPTDKKGDLVYLDPTDVIEMWSELQKAGIGTMDEMTEEEYDKAYYIYAGYYELWISDQELDNPLTLVGVSYSLHEAEEFCEMYDDDAHVVYASTLKSDVALRQGLHYWDSEDNIPVFEIEKYSMLYKTYPILSKNYKDKLLTISRVDYESMPCPLCTDGWTPEKMHELADAIAGQLDMYNFDNMSPYFEDDRDDAFWKEMENCAVDLGMKYYEDL